MAAGDWPGPSRRDHHGAIVLPTHAPARAAAALLAGALVALSLPPWGWWPLGFAGVAVLSWCLGDLPLRGRLAVGTAFGLGQFTPALWWMGEFNTVGAALVVLLETSFMAAAAAATPPGRWRALALPPALVVAEAARGTVPFGGLPMAGLGLGQVGGPLAPAARVGGELLVAGLAAAVGVAVAELGARRWLSAGGAVAVAVAAAGAGAVAPDGRGQGTVAAALVQGGGERGFRGVETDADAVFAAHLAASGRLRPPLDLVVWPEDVIDVEGAIGGTPEAGEMAGLARRLRATVVAGVVEDVGADRFRNAATVWTPDGTTGARYDKVHRVPFGEYVPGRTLVDVVAALTVIRRDAIPGEGPGVLPTPAGDLGVVISFEVFFPDRGRAATRAGGRVLLVPTNAASFSTSQVPAQELGAARLRAIETGRELVQAAPTGYGAFVDHRGRVRARTTLGRRQVLQRRVTLRSGRTLYVRTGDGPILAVAVSGVATAWALSRRRRGADRH